MHATRSGDPAGLMRLCTWARPVAPAPSRLRSMVCGGRRDSGGLCRTRAALKGYGNKGYGNNRSEGGVGGQVARVAIGGGDGGRNKSDKSTRRSRNVVNPHTWPACAKIVAVTRAFFGRGVRSEQHERGGVPAHPKGHQGSVKNGCEARRPG